MRTLNVFLYVFLCVSALAISSAAHAQTPLTPFPQPIRVGNPNGGGGGGGSGGVTGTGAANQMTFWTAATVIAGSPLNTFNSTTGELALVGSDTSVVSVGDNDGVTHTGIFPSFVSDVNDTSLRGDIDLFAHATFSANVRLMRSGGTHTAPTAVSSGAFLGGISGQGYTGSVYDGGGYLNFVAAENFSPGHIGGKFFVNTYKNASASVNTWTFDQDGSFSYGGPNTAQSGVTPIFWAEKDTAGQVLASLMNTTAAGSTEIVMGQARDATDGNYSDWSNLNSGYITDGLFTEGSTILGQNSSLSGAKMVIYTQGNFGGSGAPIVFSTNGHNTTNERARISDTGLNVPRGVLSVNIDARAQPQPAPFYSSTNTSDFGGVFANALATNGALVDTINDTGDSSYFGTTGSTGFTVAGSTLAKGGLIQSNTPGGFVLNEFASASVMIATHNVVRLTIDNNGLYTYAAAASSDATTGSCSGVTVVGNAVIGQITATCTAGQTVIMNFGATWTAAPICVSSGGTDASTSTTQATFVGLTAITGKTFQYFCGIKG